MKIKKLFEHENLDPYNEENWGKEITYDGDPIGFIEEYCDEDTKEILNDLLNSDDLDEKMDLADEILMYIEIEYPDLYDEMEDDVRGLTLA